MAKKFVDEGAAVLITGRNEESLQKVQNKLNVNIWFLMYKI